MIVISFVLDRGKVVSSSGSLKLNGKVLKIDEKTLDIMNKKARILINAINFFFCFFIEFYP